MKEKYIKVTRPRTGPGFYIQPWSELLSAIDGELNSAEVGEKIILQVVKLTDEQFDSLPEFAGW